jgi:hypothetical protein
MIPISISDVTSNGGGNEITLMGILNLQSGVGLGDLDSSNFA